MIFTNKIEAGKLLAHALDEYKGKDVVVLALPRGGVVTGFEIARYLNAPLDLVLTRKIGHPNQPEYAIAAVSENGHVVMGDKSEIASIDKKWLDIEIEKQRNEAQRRRKLYLGERRKISLKGKVVILVDDGIATGLSLLAGILELKIKKPKKIIVATPIISRDAYERIKMVTDSLVALEISTSLGSISNYYEDFSQVTDNEVISIMKNESK